MNARNWPPLRRRPAARHSDRLDLTQAPEVAHLAASLPLPPPLVGRPRPAAPVPVSREPVTEVTCGFCGVTGLSSAIPDVADYGSRCADTDACARRWASKEAATRLAGDAAPPDPGAHPYPAPEAEPVAEPEGLVHWTPEEPDQPACDADVDAPASTAMLGALNPARVTCPACQRITIDAAPEPAAGEPGPATDATDVLVDIAEQQEAAKEPGDATKVIDVGDAETTAVPAVKDEDGGEQS